MKDIIHHHANKQVTIKLNGFSFICTGKHCITKKTTKKVQTEPIKDIHEKHQFYKVFADYLFYQLSL
jgi:hypothetical protein